MATLHIEAQLSSDDLLKAMEQLETPELERFVALLIDLKARRMAPSLSPRESELLAKINQGLPAPLADRYRNLIEKRRSFSLTEEELSELLRLTDDVELFDAKRVEYLSELARLRKISLPALMTQLGIQHRRMTETRSERVRLVAERARGACEYCGSLVLYSTQSFSIEHIVPLHKGGSSDFENLAFSCQGCNGHKYTKTEAGDPVTESLFHFSILDSSAGGNFVWSNDFARDSGTTPTGRATVEALHLNRVGSVKSSRTAPCGRCSTRVRRPQRIEHDPSLGDSGRIETPEGRLELRRRGDEGLRDHGGWTRPDDSALHLTEAAVAEMACKRIADREAPRV